LKKLLIILSLFASQYLSAQYLPITSSYIYNGVYINPAYTGNREALSIDLLYRNQWAGFNGSPTTTILTGHLPLKNEKIAIGGMLFNDAIGIENNTGIYGNYAYRIRKNERTLSLGLSGGFDLLSENLNKVVANESIDPNFSINSTSILPNFSFGTYYYSKKYFLSFSVPFLLNRSYIGQNKVSIKQDFTNSNLIAEGGLVLDFNNNFVLKPSTLIKTILSLDYQVDLNLLAEYKERIGFGASYRTNATIVTILYFNFIENFTISYSYDYSVGKNSAYFGGSHEIYLRYLFKKEVNAVNPRYF